MIHKRLGDWFDTMLYLLIMWILLFFFFSYWKGQYQVRQAEGVMQEFLDKTSVRGTVTAEEYKGLVTQLNRINSNFEIEIICKQYCLQPVYDLISAEKLNRYYMSRNVKKSTVFKEYQLEVVQEDEDTLCLQSETNESIMAAANGEYLELPGEEVLFRIEAVRPYQELYEGEKIITLCKVISQEGIFYAEAESAEAYITGNIMLTLTLGEDRHQVQVQAKCYPRTTTCGYGHTIVNSHDVLEEAEQFGSITCPYCKELPEMMIFNTEILYKKTGEKLTQSDVWITVKYMDGHTEYVTPESEEWQDTYDENYCGIQQVAVCYRGKKATFTVVSENESCVQCKKECNQRSYSDYTVFPYCVECMAKVPLFTGETYEEETISQTGDIVDKLDKTGEFFMNSGDFLTLYLLKKGVYESMLQSVIKRKGSTN